MPATSNLFAGMARSYNCDEFKAISHSKMDIHRDSLPPRHEAG